MSDVFVSYARPDEPRATEVAEALRELGYRVWRDDELPAHRAYAEVIEERLKSAKAVVVLWSAEAARSQWVRSEANCARSAGTLVQATLDGSIPPLPFDQIQCADLTGWDVHAETPGWRKLVASVAELAGTVEDKSPAPARNARRQLAVCVLPFQNMSGEVEQEYFSDGISEDITTDLSKVSALAVTARNTAFQFKGQSVDVCEVARKLDVSHVLEGSVRKAGGRVRITAQLIDGATGDHAWAERYDRDLNDIFAIQDEISKAIVDALKLKLLPEEKKAIEQHGTTNVDAYNLYLMARQYWINGDMGDPRRDERIIRLCRRAIEIDANYPQAWALMALAQSNLRYAYSGNEALDDGMAAAERALSLDPTIAEAYLPRAWHYSVRGRDEEANAELAAALRLNPDSWEVNKEAARIFYRQGRIQDAIELLEKSTGVMESDFTGWGMLAASYLGVGDLPRVQYCARKVIGQVEAALARDPENGSALAGGAISFAAVGQLDRSREWIERALLLDPDNLYMRFNLAWPLVVFFQDKERALELLEPVLAKAGANLIRLVAAERKFEPLREDARFREMLASALDRVGLAQSSTRPVAAQ
ncbi:MAG TPA: TIR domain-containing protein [Sphingomicrobium sp.]